MIGPNSFPSNPKARLDLIDFNVHMQLLEEVEAPGYVQLICVDTPMFSYVNRLYSILKMSLKECIMFCLTKGTTFINGRWLEEAHLSELEPKWIPE